MPRDTWLMITQMWSIRIEFWIGKVTAITNHMSVSRSLFEIVVHDRDIRYRSKLVDTHTFPTVNSINRDMNRYPTNYSKLFQDPETLSKRNI